MKVSDQKTKQLGFISMWFLILLPVLISFGLLVLMGFFHTELENKIRKICYTNFFRAQNLASQKIDKLLSLNPRATQLMIRQRVAEAKLAAALDPLTAAAAQAEIAEILRLRGILDFQQKSIISDGQLHLLESQSRTVRELNGLKVGLSTKLSFRPLSEIRLAVKADRLDIAPTYSRDPNLESIQELGVRWSKSHFAGGPLRPWLQGSFQEEKQCSIIPKFKNQRWVFQVSQDKFW